MQIAKHRAGKVPGAGIYLMPPELYHTDPAPQPSLSSSVARELIDNTPRHAWACHPRLNAAWEPASVSRKTEVGERVHDLVCGRGRGHVRVEANDWRSGDAKKKRAARDRRRQGAHSRRRHAGMRANAARHPLPHARPCQHGRAVSRGPR